MTTNRTRVCVLGIGHAGGHKWGAVRVLPFSERCHATEGIKHPAAVSLGRLGGTARAVALTPERRKETEPEETA